MARNHLKVVKNTKGWQELKKKMRDLDGIEARTGWFTGQNYGPENQNLPIAMVAMWNEEGHINGGMFAGTSTPSRPFIRSFFMSLRKSSSFNSFVANELKLYLEGTMTSGGLALKLGKFVQEGLRETIIKWEVPPNAPSTIALKGFDKPLVESGLMARSITVKVFREVKGRSPSR